MNEPAGHRGSTDSEEAIASLSRRRFTRAGAAVPVVLGSLISKPVLAEAPYPCTISGKMSGNTSSHPYTANCSTLGVSPGYWKNHSDWPSGTTQGFLPDSSCSFSSSGPAGTRFGGYSSGGSILADAFRYKNISSACTVLDYRQGFAGATYKATLLQVLNTGSGLNSTQIGALGRSLVATILNALSRPSTYPLTAKKAIDMFNAVYIPGTKYTVNATTQWDADQVLTYFQSLYS